MMVSACFIGILYMVNGCWYETASTPMDVPLWPDGMMAPMEQVETIKGGSGDPSRTKRSIFHVSVPTITIYLPARTSAPAPVVMVCPGGAYGGLAIDKEGHDVARWLNTMGIAGVVLKYRVPTQKNDGRHWLPLQDAQRAIGCIRSRAKEWNVDAGRTGVMGFSAGGHLAANLSNNWEARAYEEVDDADRVPCRPDFAMLIYPAYLLQRGTGPELIPELQVTADTPPTFLVHAEDDPIRVDNSIYYYLALKNAKVPGHMILYPKGGHGYGLGGGKGPVAAWPLRCREWLMDSGFIRDG